MNDIHPYIKEIQKKGDVDVFFRDIEEISPITMPFIYNPDFKQQDFLFESFIEQYIHRFNNLREIHYYPDKSINIRTISTCRTIIGLGIPLGSINDVYHILTLNNLCYLDGVTFLYKKSNGTLTALKRKLKYKKIYYI